jgi:redox-sensitive bicupin YhaK (pirin superfamily)
LPVETERHAFAYVFEGSGSFRSPSQPFGVLTEKESDGSEALIRERTGNRSLVLFDSGDEVTVQASEEGIRLLLVSGKPLREPIAWYGPILMNTQAELQQAVRSFEMGPSSRAAESSLRCCNFIVPRRFRAPEARRKAEVAAGERQFYS